MFGLTIMVGALTAATAGASTRTVFIMMVMGGVAAITDRAQFLYDRYGRGKERE